MSHFSLPRLPKPLDGHFYSESTLGKALRLFQSLLTPFTLSHFRDYNNWPWLKSLQATWTITKYNDNIHNGHKRTSLLNLHAIWIEMLILIICFYKKVCLDLFLFAFSFPPVNVVFLLLLCMLCELWLICVWYIWFISVTLYSFLKSD